MRFTAWLLPFALLVVTACDENPDERTLITGPRLLAVQSTPPALRGLEGNVSLNVLAVAESGATLSNAGVVYRVCSPWQFLADPARDCSADTALILQDRELTTQDVLAYYPLPEGLMPPVASDDMPATESCGATALVEVPVVAEMVVDGISLVTVKRIPVYFDETRKRNPRFDAVEVASVIDGEHTLRISVDPDSLDIECRDDVEGLEALRIYVYSTSGSFESSTVDIVPAIDGTIEPAEILWTSGNEPAVLLFIVIDRDGGIGWRSLSL